MASIRSHALPIARVYPVLSSTFDLFLTLLPSSFFNFWYKFCLGAMRYLSIPTFVTYILLSGTFSWASHPSKTERKCYDGSLGIVRHVEEKPNQPTVFTVDCSSTRPQQELSGYNSTANLEKRASCLSLSGCTTTCYAGTPGPTQNDCENLDSWLTNRAQQNTVQSGQEIHVTSGSCMFRFYNQAYGSVVLCDTFWAPSSGSIYRACLPNSPAGGFCQASGFKLDVCLNPDAPATTSTTSTIAAPVYVTPTTTTTQAPQGNNQQSSTPGASSISTTGSSSSTTSGSGSKSSTSSATTHSYTNSLGLLTYSVDLPLPSATIAQALGPSVSDKMGTNHTPAIVGAILGVLALIGILVALWFWRRRLRKIREQGVPIEDRRMSDPVRQSQMTAVAPSTSGGSGGYGGYGPVTMGFGSNSKVALMQRQAAPVSEYSDGPEHLFSPTQDSASVPSTPRTNTSYFYQTETPPAPPPPAVENTRLEPEGPRRSISARTLAQALAPDLSERDITRLADTIVARMQATAPPVTHHHGRESLVSNSEYTEPPPPWRASWNGRNGSESTDTRSSAA